MNELPLVSILMPSYNSSKYIRQAIDSILNQTYKNWELLILDDHSTDETLSVITEYNHPNVKVYRNEINLGYLKSCNFLFKQVSGELITFQDSDDWSSPERIEMQVFEFAKDSLLGFCATRSRTEVTIDGLTIDSTSNLDSCEAVNKYINDNEILPFTCATLMIKRDVLKFIGPYRDFFDRIGAEHVDWAYMICENFPGKVVDQILYFYRFNVSSFTKVLDYSIQKRKSLEYAKFFHLQRLKFGKDSLQGLSQKYLDDFSIFLMRPYIIDKSLLYREMALDFLNKRIYPESLILIYKGILVKPFSIQNWKTFAQILLRSCFAVLWRNKIFR